MEINGKLTEILPEQTGQGKTGNGWRKRSFIIETMEEQYPKKVCVDAWGERIDNLLSIGVGNEISVSFDLESREFNGRWYTSVKAWKIDRKQGASSSTKAPLPSVNDMPPPMEPTDDLPF
jgi:nuclear transport factor 2 (NTF2) superfamily protein